MSNNQDPYITYVSGLSICWDGRFVCPARSTGKVVLNSSYAKMGYAGGVAFDL